MIIKWKKKPVVIEAVEWTGSNVQEMEEFGIFVSLDSLEVGSYIVKEANGKAQVYPREVFHATYERHLIWDENI
jgi:hypothetical protein